MVIMSKFKILRRHTEEEPRDEEIQVRVERI